MLEAERPKNVEIDPLIIYNYLNYKLSNKYHDHFYIIFITLFLRSQHDRTCIAQHHPHLGPISAVDNQFLDSQAST